MRRLGRNDSSIMKGLRRWSARNFVLAMTAAIVVFAWIIVVGLQDTTPTGQQISRSPLGASVLLFFEGLLAFLFWRRGELRGLVRVFAAVLGIVGLLQSALVPVIVHELYGYPLFSWQAAVMWYAYVSHLLFAAIGGPRERTAGRKALKA